MRVDEREVFGSVAERAGLSREEAADLTRASLQALVQRLSEGTAREVVLHLPDRLGDEVRRTGGTPSRHSGLSDVEIQVSERAGLRRDEVHAGLVAVLATMREAMPAEVLDKALAQLPREFRDLVPD